MHPSLRKLTLTLGCAFAAAMTVHGAAPATLADFQALAAKSNCTLVLPKYPVTPAELRALADGAMKEADAALDAIAAQDPSKLTFANTFGAGDAAGVKIGEAATIIGTIAESSTDKAMRDTANEVSVKLEEWGVALDYREPLYRTLKAYADTKPTLDPEQQRLVDFQMRDYRRAGLSLPP
ncbi:MAG TPA: hypothetical protein PLU52_13355, partial [Opitutaceae bacterium]|nr:hypothetical protein [Opitutaceae bacterium]